jgi:hypothetical protein
MYVIITAWTSVYDENEQEKVEEESELSNVTNAEYLCGQGAS